MGFSTEYGEHGSEHVYCICIHTFFFLVQTHFARLYFTDEECLLEHFIGQQIICNVVVFPTLEDNLTKHH